MTAFVGDGSWLVVPDLHGHGARLAAAERVMDRFPDSKVAFLGDLIDDAPFRREGRRAQPRPGKADESREVLQMVRSLVEKGRAVILLGNHEVLALLGVLEGQEAARRRWWSIGGRETAASYDWDGKGDATATALADDLRWLRDHATLWLEIGPPQQRVLLAHATRPTPERVASDRNRMCDLTPNPLQDPVVWFALGKKGTALPPLPPGVQASLHGHVERPGIQHLTDRQGKKVVQLDLAPGKQKLAVMRVGADGQLGAVVEAVR